MNNKQYKFTKQQSEILRLYFGLENNQSPNIARLLNIDTTLVDKVVKLVMIRKIPILIDPIAGDVDVSEEQMINASSNEDIIKYYNQVEYKQNDFKTRLNNALC